MALPVPAEVVPVLATTLVQSGINATLPCHPNPVHTHVLLERIIQSRGFFIRALFKAEYPHHRRDPASYSQPIKELCKANLITPTLATTRTLQVRSPSIDKPRLRHNYTQRRASPSARMPPLPTELLLSIFEVILAANDTFTAYKNLLHTSLVCRLWRRGAQLVLLNNIEVVREEDAAKLVHLLKAECTGSEASPVETLAIGVRGYSYSFITRPTFGELLGCTPRLRKLIVFHTNSLPNSTFYHEPPHLSNLTTLVDVTLAAVGSNAYRDVPQLSLLRYLPKSVRFLHVLLPEPPNLEKANLIAPQFSLYGLTIAQYPSPMASLILTQPSETLQCLTVWKLTDLSHLAKFQPRLRSLKVLGTIPESGALSDLQRLERLELRTYNLQRDILDSMPNTLQYLRFWPTDLAWKLQALLTDEARLPQLRIVVWDYWFSDGEQKKAGPLLIETLGGTCASRNVDFRAYCRATYAVSCQVVAFLSNLEQLSD